MKLKYNKWLPPSDENGQYYYYTKNVKAILDIPERMLIDFVEKGYIVPYIDANGLGSKRQYSKRNLIEIAICKRLRDFGISAYLRKRILNVLRNDESLDCPQARVQFTQDDILIHVVVDVAKIKEQIGNRIG